MGHVDLLSVLHAASPAQRESNTEEEVCVDAAVAVDSEPTSDPQAVPPVALEQHPSIPGQGTCELSLRPEFIMMIMQRGR